MRTSNLAYRIPVLAASLSLLAGCYTMLRHPTPDVTEGEHETRTFGSDCGSCHMGGFDQALLPDPYPYVSDPFIWFYEPPYLFPRRPGPVGLPGRGGGVAGADADGDKTVEDGRFVGSRGPGLSKLPNPPAYTPPTAGPSVSDPGATGPASRGSSPPESGTPSGPQPGRMIKNDDDSKDSKKAEPTQRETIKDGSGG